MGPDDRPEDEREPTAGAEPDVEAPDEEPDVLAMFGDDEGTAPEPPEGSGDEDDGGSEGPVGPVAPDAEVPARAGPPRHRALRVFAVVGSALAVGILLVGWNRVAASDDFCASCHEIEPAVTSAERSVHDDVPCLSCHTGSGLLGTLRYLPTLARETFVQRRARERRLDGDLHLVESARAREFPHLIERLRPRAVQPQDKAAVHRDAVRLDRVDGRTVVIELP